MEIVVCESKDELGRRAAQDGAQLLRDSLAAQGEAVIIVATGASQFEMLRELVQLPGIDWSRVTAFHLDEYVGMPMSHPASFRRYLKERFVDLLPTPICAFHYINAESDAHAECERLNAIIASETVDVAFVGIGENGHLAFNDPPANFETDQPYIVVDLDQACRQQQLGEGWFSTLEEVPLQAISMSVRQIMASRHIVCSVPDERKARAVQGAVEGALSPHVPASILQKHDSTRLYLDPPSASLLKSR